MSQPTLDTRTDEARGATHANGADGANGDTDPVAAGAARLRGRRRWPFAVGGFVAAVATIALATPALLKWEPIRAHVAPHVTEEYQWPGPTDMGLRQVLMRNRDQALGRGDLVGAAMVNADLAHEALLRAAATHRAWMRLRDEKTKLFPQSTSVSEWNYRNTAADFFGFQLHAGLRLRPDSVPALLETLAAEAALAPPGELCQPVDARTGEVIDVDETERMFSSSEYVKDGLLSVYERFGADPVGPRMFQVLDAILAHSKHNSRFGPIPGQGSEVNGNVLQACSRLSFAADTAERREAYAQMAARIADAVTQQMLPACNHLPVRTFDYELNRAVETRIKLRDHGNEVMPGLAEAYAMAVARAAAGGPDAHEWRARADRWAGPIADLLETVFEKGTNADGLPLSAIDTATFEITNDMPSDNWGYVLNGVILFAQAARLHGGDGGAAVPEQRLAGLEAHMDRAISAVIQLYGAGWEGHAMDGYCDTLESALYVARHRPSRADELLPWVDDQIGLLFGRQHTNGFAARGYLDGNFIRTSLLYADQKSGGWRVAPFRDDVRVGFIRAAARPPRPDGTPRPLQSVLVIATGNKSYTGTLHADGPRHRSIMNLPWDWPRLNCWPEWFDVSRAGVTGADGLPATPTPEQLARGIQLDLPPHALVVLRFEEPITESAPGVRPAP